MDYFQRRLRRLDKFQRSHAATGFTVAVVKKYGEDRGGQQAALLTYYGFLSLFPALLIITTVAQWLLYGQSHFKQRLIGSVTNSFPVIGHQLQQNVHGFSRTGLPLIIGILVVLYGLRGTADVFRHMVNNVWRIPDEDRGNFWSSQGRNLAIVLVGGLGYLVSATVASYAASNGRILLLKLLLLLIEAALVFTTILMVLRLSLNRKIAWRQLIAGAIAATIGLVVLQNLGARVLAHELHNLDNLYGTFAVVLGLFFWLYLQTQILVYAIVLDSVRGLKLWPRRLFGEDK